MVREFDYMVGVTADELPKPPSFAPTATLAMRINPFGTFIVIAPAVERRVDSKGETWFSFHCKAKSENPASVVELGWLFETAFIPLARVR